MYAVYTLSDRAGNVRWIGMTSNPDSRYASHCCSSEKTHVNPKLREWVHAMRPNRPVMKILVWIESREEAVRIEAILTELWKSKLFNINLGSSLSERQKEYLSAKARVRPGKIPTEETLVVMAESAQKSWKDLNAAQRMVRINPSITDEGRATLSKLARERNARRPTYLQFLLKGGSR